MRQNRDCRGSFAAAAAVKCYSTELGNQLLLFAENRDFRGIIAAAAVKWYSFQLVNQMVSFASKSRQSHNYRGGSGLK